jgi:hypothetical protein
MIAKLFLSLILLLVSSLGYAKNPSIVGEVVSEQLTLESSGFWGRGRFVALPKGDWRVLKKEAWPGHNSTHTGYFLKSEDKENPATHIIVIFSSTPNYWNRSFYAVPADASMVNLYTPSWVTKQSFYFSDLALTNYLKESLERLKVTETLLMNYSINEFALSVTRNISQTNDIQFISIIRKDGKNIGFEDYVKAWNDQVVNTSYESFYKKNDSLGGVLAFREVKQVQASVLDEKRPLVNVKEVPIDRLSTSNQSGKLVVQSIPKNADTSVAHGESNRLGQQSQDLKLPLLIDKTYADMAFVNSIQASPSGVVKTRRHALIIGNNDYRNVSKLDNAVSDAKSIAALLGQLEYEVVVHDNLGEKQFKTALRQFKQKLKGGDEVVFFFAGHGVQIGSANFLLPIDVGSDSEEQIRDEGIPLQRVMDDFSEAKVKFSLAVIDACRDNPFKSQGRSIGGRGLLPTSAANGQMIIFSAGAGQQALDRLGKNDKEKNGLFTRVLINKVSISKEPIHILMRDVRKEVASLAQTVGHEQVPAIYDQVIGDFYFVPKR